MTIISQTLVSAALIAIPPVLDAPRQPPPDFADSIDHTELYGTSSEVQLVAYDSHEEVIGTLAIWVEAGGELVLASDYADGYAEIVVVEGHAVLADSNLDPSVIQRRADLMLDTLDMEPLDIDHGGPSIMEGKLGCAMTLAASAAACASLAGGNPWGVLGCPAGVIASWCKCAPVFGKDGGSICNEL